MDYLVFRTDGAIKDRLARPAGYDYSIWTPSLTGVRPYGVPRVAFTIWWAFHHARVFANRSYAVVLVHHAGQVVHYMGVFPSYFRFGFMGIDDLQFGDVWTHPDHRGQGIAPNSYQFAMETLARPGRAFWTIVAEVTTSSIKVATRAGFTLYGHAERTEHLGTHLLGRYELRNSELAG